MVRLLRQEPAYNLYFLGNLESLGFDDAICEWWGSFRDGRLVGVLMRYMSGWNVYDTPGTDLAAFGRIVDVHPAGAKRLQDNTHTAPSLLPFLRRYRAARVTPHQLCDLNAADFTPLPLKAFVRRAILTDLEALAAFYADAGKMTRSRRAIQRPLQAGRVFVAEVNGEIVSAALTNAETDDLAMIGGVYTPPSHRNRGYASSVMTELCRSLLNDGKRPVLYYEDPAAATVYHRLGFRERGVWRSVWLEPG